MWRTETAKCDTVGPTQKMAQAEQESRDIVIAAVTSCSNVLCLLWKEGEIEQEAWKVPVRAHPYPPASLLLYCLVHVCLTVRIH